MWSGLCLGVTPALTAMLSPFWGRLADRFGRKIMVERSLVSFVVVMGAMAYVQRPWHVFALRAMQGFFAGYGSLTLAMAADSAPRDRMAYAIGFVQTAQRLGPAIGPIVGGAVAQIAGLRNAFLVTACFYLVAVLLVVFMYDEAPMTHSESSAEGGRVTFRNMLAFENFILLMAVVFGLQFVDRSFGPVLPLFVTELGTPVTRVAIVSGCSFRLQLARALLDIISAGGCSSGFPRGCHCGQRSVGAAGAFVYVLAHGPWLLLLGTPIFGVAIGVATRLPTPPRAASCPRPVVARGSGVTTASLAGLALSPIVSGILGATSIRAVFVLDAVGLLTLAWMVSRLMIVAPSPTPRRRRRRM